MDSDNTVLTKTSDDKSSTTATSSRKHKENIKPYDKPTSDEPSKSSTNNKEGDDNIQSAKTQDDESSTTATHRQHNENKELNDKPDPDELSKNSTEKTEAEYRKFAEPGDIFRIIKKEHYKSLNKDQKRELSQLITKIYHILHWRSNVQSNVRMDIYLQKEDKKPLRFQIGDKGRLLVVNVSPFSFHFEKGRFERIRDFIPNFLLQYTQYIFPILCTLLVLIIGIFF